MVYLLWNSKCLVAAVDQRVDLNPTGTNGLFLPLIHGSLSLFFSLEECRPETSDSVVFSPFNLDRTFHQLISIEEVDHIIFGHLPRETSKLQGYVVVVAN